MASPEEDLPPAGVSAGGSTTETMADNDHDPEEDDEDDDNDSRQRFATTVRDNGSRQLPQSVFAKVLAPYPNGIPVTSAESRNRTASCRL